GGDGKRPDDRSARLAAESLAERSYNPRVFSWGRSAMPSTRPIAIYHEQQEWFRPLFSELDRRGTPYVRVDARRHRYDVAAREREYALLFNRMSPSAYLRGTHH